MNSSPASHFDLRSSAAAAPLPPPSANLGNSRKFLELLTPNTPLDSTDLQMNLPQWLEGTDLRQSLDSLILNASRPSTATRPFAPQRFAASATNPFDKSGSYTQIISGLAEEVRNKKKLEKKKSTARAHEIPASPASTTETMRNSSTKSKLPETPKSPFSTLAQGNSEFSRSPRSRSPVKKHFPPHVPGSQYCLTLGIHDHFNEKHENSSQGKENFTWFDQMEHKLRELAKSLEDNENSSSSSNGSSNGSQNELQRLKYAVLIQKLEELNSFHHQYLLEEREKLLHSHMEKEKARELQFLEKIQAMEKEIRDNLLQDHQRERERENLEKEKQQGFYERLLQEKEEMIKELLSEQGKLQEKILQGQQEQEKFSLTMKEMMNQQQFKEKSDRENEREEFHRQRREWTRQLEILQLDRLEAGREIQRLKTEWDGKSRESHYLQEELLSWKYKARENEEKWKEYQLNKEKFHSLQLEYDQYRESSERKETHWNEEREENRRLIERLMKQIQDWEIREERRRKWQVERNLAKNSGKRYEEMMNSPLDSAWASGPVERNRLFY